MKDTTREFWKLLSTDLIHKNQAVTLLSLLELLGAEAWAGLESPLEYLEVEKALLKIDRIPWLGNAIYRMSFIPFQITN